MTCEQCINESQTDIKLPCSSLQNTGKHITGPEVAIQIDLVPEVPPSGGNENIATAIDVFPGHVFAYPTMSQDAKTVAQVKINIKS